MEKKQYVEPKLEVYNMNLESAILSASKPGFGEETDQTPDGEESDV